MTPRTTHRRPDTFAAGLHDSLLAGATGGLTLDPGLRAEVDYRRERIAVAAYGRQRRVAGRRAARVEAQASLDDSRWVTRWIPWPLSVSRRRSSAVGENWAGSRS